MQRQANTAETPTRVLALAGAVHAWPLWDLRVVTLALRFPVTLRIPYPSPKPMLKQALLMERDRDLVKGAAVGFTAAVAQGYVQGFPGAVGPGTLSTQRGFVRTEGFAAARDPRWEWDTGELVMLEFWLREVEGKR